VKEGRWEASKEGRKEGRKEGKTLGRKEGRKEGWKEVKKKEGRDEGRKEGKKEGTKEGTKLAFWCPAPRGGGDREWPEEGGGVGGFTPVVAGRARLGDISPLPSWEMTGLSVMVRFNREARREASD
jgi:hypothetical protein